MGNMQRSCDISSKNSCISLIWIPQLLTFFHIWFIILFSYNCYCCFLNHLRMNCGHDVPLPLNPSTSITTVQPFDTILLSNPQTLFRFHGCSGSIFYKYLSLSGPELSTQKEVYQESRSDRWTVVSKPVPRAYITSNLFN